MIIWISGAYGVGKSTLADAMAARMEKPLIFDARVPCQYHQGPHPGGDRDAFDYPGSFLAEHP